MLWKCATRNTVLCTMIIERWRGKDDPGHAADDERHMKASE